MQIYSKPGTKERLFEMMKGVNKLKENYDSPEAKDLEYLSKSVDALPTEVVKMDGDLDYPVEKDLRVKSDMIHQEPVKEDFDYNQAERDHLGQQDLDAHMQDEMGAFKQTQFDYNDNGAWIPKGHEDKNIGIRPSEQPIGSGNKKELIVKLGQGGGTDEVLDQADTWDDARQRIQKYLSGAQGTQTTTAQPSVVSNPPAGI